MHVLNVLADDRVGGPQVRSRQVADVLRDQGVKTIFAVPAGDGDFKGYARDGDFEVLTVPYQRLRSPRAIGANLRFLVRFREIVRSFRSLISSLSIDVVHVNSSVNFQAAKAATRSDTALLWHFNDTLTPTPVKQIAAAAGRRWADCLVVAADAVREYYFPNSKVDTETVYAPVDPGIFDPDNDVPWPNGLLSRNAPPDDPVVGTIANVNPAKGLEYFIKAVELVQDAVGPVHAPVVGKQLASQRQYEQSLRKLIAEHDLEDTVTLCGYRDDITAVLSAFDVFVLPSVSEACPMVILEAMAMERPIVATDVGGVREQMTDEEHGYVVPPRNPKLIADRITTILDQPGIASKMGAQARIRARDRFSLSTIAKRTMGAYNTAIQQSAGDDSTA